MKLNLAKLQSWINQRNERESLFIFLAGFFVIYFLWNILFEMPLQAAIDDYAKKNTTLASDIAAQQQSLTVVELIVNKPSFKRDLERQKLLKSESINLGQELNRLALELIPEAKMKNVTNDLIAEQNLTSLQSLKAFTPEEWTPPKSMNLDTQNDIHGISKYPMALNFKANYFSTIEFLSHLEKLPYHLFWDSLDYKVASYPEAEVELRLYVLSNQKGES